MRLAGFALFLWMIGLLWDEPFPDGEKLSGTKSMAFGEAIKQELALALKETMYVQFIPAAVDCAGESGWNWLVRTQTESLMPLYGIQGNKEEPYMLVVEEESAIMEPMEEIVQETPVETDGKVQTEAELLALLEAENEAVMAPIAFEPRTRRVQVDLEELRDYETLVKLFYTIDANTTAGTDQLNVESLLKEDVSIEKRTDGPQILIYHTHSQETFADSVQGDKNTSIVGVGERLAQILQEEYGYQVLHHTGQYDVDSRDDAYGKSLPALEQLLKENPTIEVVIDLHRDQMPEETKLVMDLDGRPTARFMFFNGLSRTRQSGDIDYLKNENIDMNLALSFQMQLKCEEYYPGLTRKIYLKGYRYNMHLCPRTMLVELGAQNNTVEEAMNACDPLAHVIDMVLAGE
ncbi:MAG: stage II sporulation protein P [Lachnospiraceae bacterium]|nr:stage II sporulation protein P [Lachnospiraceae bacterium]